VHKSGTSADAHPVSMQRASAIAIYGGIDAQQAAADL